MPEPEKQSPPPDNREAAHKNFAELLRAHLFSRGTRSTGSPETIGKAWSIKEFAAAVGRTERAINYWINEKVVPSDIASIERELFGDNVAFAAQRAELRVAYQAARPRNRWSLPEQLATPVSRITDHTIKELQAHKKGGLFAGLLVSALGHVVDLLSLVPATYALIGSLLTFVTSAVVVAVRREPGFWAGICAATIVATPLLGLVVGYQKYTGGPTPEKTYFVEQFSWQKEHISWLEKSAKDMLEKLDNINAGLNRLIAFLLNLKSENDIPPGPKPTPAPQVPTSPDHPSPPFQSPRDPPSVALPDRPAEPALTGGPSFLLTTPIGPGSVAVAPVIPMADATARADPRTRRSQRILEEISQRQKHRNDSARSDMRIAAREFRARAAASASSGNLNEAIRLYTVAIQNDAILSDYLSLGDAFYNSTEYFKAVEAYSAALKMDTKLAAAYAARGDSYREQHKAELVGLAAADYHDAVAANPDYAPAYNGLGNLASDDRKYEAAIGYYTTAIQHDQRFAIAYANLGNTYYQIQNYDASIANCKDSIKYDGNRAVPHTCLGNAYWKKGLYDDALTEYHQAEQLDEFDANPTNGVGNVYLSLRNDAKAIEQYRLALKKNDKFALPYNGLGNIAYWAGQYPQAISYYDQATNKDSKFAVAYSNRGNAKLAIGDKEGASVDYERAISLDDKLANPYLGRGKILALKGKWKDALIDFDIAVNLDNENSDAYFFRGIARQSNFVGGSIDDFSSAVQLNPSYTDAYAARAAAYAGMQEYSKAFADLDKALGIDPTSRFALLQRLAIHLGMLDYDAAISDCNRLTGSGLESVFYIVCGSALAAKGDVAGAASNFGRIGQIDSPALFHYGKAMLFVLPGNENIPDAIAELNEAIRQGTAMPAMDSAMFVVRASLYAMRGQKGDDDLARQDFERAIQLAPNAANYKARGDFSIRVRDYDKAIHDFKKATDIAPKFADAHRALGEAYVFSGRSDSYDQALKPFDAAIANAPRATDYFYEGEIYRMRVAPNEDSVATDYQMAIDNYTKALELDPHLIEALWGRALAHQSLNENSAALGDFSEAVKADPKDIAALDWRARFYESIGDYSNAVADIDTAIKIAGASSILFERKGQIYLESGDADSAVKNFDLALNAGPANDWPDHFNRGTAYLHLEQYMRAIQDFTETLRLNPKFFLALHQRGNVYFMMQNYSRAIADYQRIFQFNPRDAEAALMTYIVQKRLGDSRAEKQLQTFAEDAGSTAEPDALIELFLRRHTADDVLAVPKDVLSACTKSYFIGEWHLLQNAQDAAKVSFEEAIKTCAKNDPWYAGAKVELRLLTSAWYRVWAALWGRIYAWTGPAASPS